jgi:hypothetical protein
MSIELVVNECPICMCDIEETNKVITECGHAFHCSCLMQNAAHDRFECPCCRATMATPPESDDSDSEYDSDYEYESDMFGDRALQSFRLFHQQLNNEELEDVEDVEDDDDAGSEDLDDNEYELPISSEYIASELLKRNVSYDDLVKCILFTGFISNNENASISYRTMNHIDRILNNFRNIPEVNLAIAHDVN